MMPDEAIALSEAADIAARSPVALRRAAASGALEATKVGKTWVTTRRALAAYMAYVSQQGWMLDPARRPGPKARAGSAPRARGHPPRP